MLMMMREKINITEVFVKHLNLFTEIILICACCVSVQSLQAGYSVVCSPIYVKLFSQKLQSFPNISKFSSKLKSFPAFSSNAVIYLTNSLTLWLRFPTIESFLLTNHDLRILILNSPIQKIVFQY